ncbi:UNVERIFIED_CONTAM: Transposon Ty3-I Gag-Pol polyprotein [Sesamum latifolium]|uniref:Transposon Ty3-I Gag-Pol polyprotein n=1 Tax=Sesamum latifolium TaxID=2727402 RepID=A0AAW2TS78_9LAMI
MELERIKNKVEAGSSSDFHIKDDGSLYMRNKLCVPSDSDLKQNIISEAHRSRLSVHPGSTKMYRDLKENFWWNGMKRDIAEYISKFITCQKLKAEHQKLGGWLQPLEIPEWKWEHVTMDFVLGLPRTRLGLDAIWLVVDCLTKSAHFSPIRTTYTLEKLAGVYIDNIVRLHGIPISIVSDRDPRFPSRFWRSFQQALGKSIQLSTTYHPQTNGQSERTIQTLEDMLRACVLDFKGGWNDYLTLVEFPTITVIIVV